MFSHKTCPRTQKRYITGRPPGGRHNLMQKVEPHIVEVEPRSQRQCHYFNIQFFFLPNCANNGYNDKLELSLRPSSWSSHSRDPHCTLAKFNILVRRARFQVWLCHNRGRSIISTSLRLSEWGKRVEETSYKFYSNSKALKFYTWNLRHPHILPRLLAPENLNEITDWYQIGRGECLYLLVHLFCVCVSPAVVTVSFN